MTPEQIHQLGLAEVARIRGEMDEVRAAAGFEGTHGEFVAFLRSEPRFYVDPEVYGEKASEIRQACRHGAAALLRPPAAPHLRRRADPGGPRKQCEWLPARQPETGVPGLVVYKPWMARQMPVFGPRGMGAARGVPGHHLQIALAQEMTDLPEFRRNDDITSYVEGWGLYAEKLGEDFGLYRDAYERFGRLSLEIWRACRLVVDTGMHVMGWSREQAVDCLRDNSALAPAEIEYEVDRYIAWPGQALAYKVGEQKILQLRRRASERLGARSTCAASTTCCSAPDRCRSRYWSGAWTPGLRRRSLSRGMVRGSSMHTRPLLLLSR